MNQLIRISAWSGFADLVSELGADPQAVLAEADLTLEDISAPEDFLPFELFIRSLNAAEKATGRTDFGLLSAAKGGLQVLGILGIAIRNSRTPREALAVCTRFVRANNTATSLATVPIPGTTAEFICLGNAYPPGPETVQLYERILASLHAIARSVGSDCYIPVEFRLPHAPHSSIETYEKFFGMTPKFNQPTFGIVLESDAMGRQIPGRSAELGEFAMTQLRAFASEDNKLFADTVRTIAKILIEIGACTPADMANALNVHERTLQRRLREEGLSFELVRDRARKEIAQVLLRQDAHSLTEIAYILGYAESSSFSHSCKRWFGDTPKRVREKLTAS